jgi:hypothetical protein
MQLNPFKMISSGTQKMLLGGLVGSLVYYADLAIADTQPTYPGQLKARLAPQLPRNDELLTTIAPPVAMYVLGKKSKKLKEIAKGTMLYSVPRLIDRVIVNAVTPVASAGMFSLKVVPSPVQVTAPIQVQKVVPPAAVSSVGAGKYR